MALCGGAEAKLVEEQVDLPVEVEDAYGKSVAMPIKVSFFVDDHDAGAASGAGHQPRARVRRVPSAPAMGRYRPTEVVRWFARQGFVVAVPTRIGYGATGGEDVEDSGACTRKTYAPGLLRPRRSRHCAVIEAATARADALKDRTVVVGQSYGGATSVAVAASQPGRRGRRDQFRRRQRRQPEDERARAVRAGAAAAPVRRLRAQRARVPMLWIYTENDLYWGAEYPKAWLAAFREGGGRAEFIQFPPHGDDGHTPVHALSGGVATGGAPRSCAQQGFDVKESP